MNSQTRFPGLDGLRAVFCIGLVLYHINEIFHSAFGILFSPAYHYGGYFGNYIFFLISGLLISFHYKKQIREQTILFSQYLLMRLRKFVPLYILSNAAMILYQLLDHGYASLNLTRLTAAFLLTPSGWLTQDTPYNHPAWFICVLMLCYLLYYIICRITCRLSRLYLPLCLILILWGMLLEKKAWNLPLNYRICGEGYMNFFIGVLLAEIITCPFFQEKPALLLNILCFCFLTIIILFCGFDVFPVDMRWIITLLCVNLICIVICGEYAVRLLSFPPVQTIGKYSFSIYIWHIPVVWWFLYIENLIGLSFIDARINMGIYFVLLFFVSRVSYRYLESKYTAESSASLL